MSLNVAATAENTVSYPVNSTAETSGASVSEAVNETKPENKTDAGSGVVYEQSKEPQKKATYSINKMSAEDRAKLVEQLKKDEEIRRNQLSSLVQKMFSGQAGVARLADLFSPENLKTVSAEEIAQAQEDVSEDGYWGVKQTSQRLFDFASALAGDDVDKMKDMQKAMEKGFKLATDAWGKDLPDISKETLKAANKLFEDYYSSKGVTTEK